MSKEGKQSVAESTGAGKGGFVGRYDHALDPKKRFTIPSEWRDLMGNPKFVYVMPDPKDRCVNIVPTVEMDARLEKLREKALFDRINASENEAMLVCLVEGKVAGNCQIALKTSIKTRHRAAVAIALLKEYWNQGIGTRMFQEMIRIAEESPNILQMELEFVEGNTRARALYEKMGFRITGVKPNAIRMKDGTLLNEYAMIREIRI